MTSNALKACPKMIKDEAIFIEIEIYSMLKKIISRGKIESSSEVSVKRGDVSDRNKLCPCWGIQCWGYDSIMMI